MGQMYCDQCEQTLHGKACTEMGVCGKNPDVESLQKILLYGLKGLAAYAHHARRLGQTDEAVNAFVEEALFATVTNVNFDIPSLLDMVLECGRQNLRVMQMLNDGHVAVMGNPEPAEISEGIQDGPGILITGHDMVDLKALLEQAEPKGVKVYTHGEMLPAHMYPKLRVHKNLAGNYGGAWQKQRDEFERFGGPVVATTNCIMPPRPNATYLDHFYTMRCTAMPGAKVIKGSDFSEVIDQALKIGPLQPTPIKKSTVGFHHSVILSLAGQIVEAVKAGKISHFYVIGGCDGAEPGRNYFTEFAQNAPADSIILTLGCGKYRIREHDYGTLELAPGVVVPRLLDMGQCNDAYGAIQVALALAGVFKCGVNDLPLTLCISWFEQKAVAVLLTLLALDVKGIRLGPALPAFVTPNVFKVLQDKFDLKGIGASGKEDVAATAGK